MQRGEGQKCKHGRPRKSTVNPLAGQGFATHGTTLFVKEPVPLDANLKMPYKNGFWLNDL